MSSQGSRKGQKTKFQKKTKNNIKQSRLGIPAQQQTKKQSRSDLSIRQKQKNKGRQNTVV